MEELYYQIDLLAAMNAKLNSSEKMYRLICDTSNNAFLYYNFEEEHMEMLGAWNSFFDFTVNDLKDFAKFQDCVEEPYKIPIKKCFICGKNWRRTYVSRVLFTRRKNLGRRRSDSNL